MVIFLLLLIPLFVDTTFAQESNLTKNSNIGYEKNNTDNLASQLIQLTGVLGSIAIGTLGTRYIVNRWQEKKETSEIRKEVLRNYQESIKDYLVLMETFVAKIVFRSVTIGTTPTDAKGIRMNTMRDLLPYGYTYELPSDYAVEVQNQTFLFSNRSEKLNNDFTNLEFLKFEKEFFNKRASITKFTSGVRQYYQNGRDLSKKLDDLWNRIMILHILLHIMISAKQDEDFVSLLKQFNTSIDKLFNDVVEYDYTLADESIKVEKKSAKVLS